MRNLSRLALNLIVILIVGGVLAALFVMIWNWGALGTPGTFDSPVRLAVLGAIIAAGFAVISLVLKGSRRDGADPHARKPYDPPDRL